MKLKTLKDLPHYFSRDGKQDLLFEQHIKAEAIKWVKFYEGNNDIAAAGAIGHFFNITSEDLK